MNYILKLLILLLSTTGLFQFAAAGDDAEIKVRITVSNQLVSKRFTQNWPVHIYLAEPGSRIPLSSKTVTLNELPVSITLTEKDYVLPMFTLKGKQQLVLITKISSSGDPHKQGPEDFRQTSPVFSLNDQYRASVEMVLEE